MDQAVPRSRDENQATSPCFGRALRKQACYDPVLGGERHAVFTVGLAVLIASAASAALLAVSPAVFRFLGQRGANALERLMGMLLVMISIQMILDGVDAYLSLRC
jgi:hypothetical protein